MENENAWTVRGKKKDEEESEKDEEEARNEKAENVGYELGNERRRVAAKETRTTGRSRSCVAQRETFNSVTPGLNYHAETIVPGKIKKGAPPLSFVGPRTIVLRRGARKLEYDEENSGMGGGREGQRRNPFFVCRTGCCARFNSTATHGAREREEENRGDKK